MYIRDEITKYDNKEKECREILSDITVYGKYARFLPEAGRRETWEEIVGRNALMHMERYPDHSDEIGEVYSYVLDKKVFPSMRSLQFGGLPIHLSPNRMFNCYKSSTRFITNKGTVSFDDFEHGDEITVPSHTGNMRKAIVKSYGKQTFNKVILRRGKVKKHIEVTSNHRWLLRDGTETTSLKEGDILLGSPKIFGNFDYDNADPMEKLYWCYGYVYGDGTRVTSGKNKYSMVRLCGDDKNKFLYRFKEMGFKTSEPLSCDGDCIVYTGKYQKTSPDPDVDDYNMIKSFVIGYLDADGSKNPDWYINSDLSPYVGIQSSEKDHIEFIEKCFESIGFYITSKRDLTGQKTNYGTRPLTKTFRLSTKVGTTNVNNHWVVESITSNVSNDIAWCLEVEEDHSFILSGGIVTGNCAFTSCDNIAVFSETMFLLLGGSGVGYSVQQHHVDELPELQGPKNRKRRYLVGDSIEGWADAIKILMESYFQHRSRIEFDYRDIRRKGALLVTSGGKAPGPMPLKKCIENIRNKLDSVLTERGAGTQLKPIEVHDIMCFIADAVLAGGIRRAALISLFSFDDNEMMSCKSGAWWEKNPQRGRANNSVVLVRHKIKKEDFYKIWELVEASKAGEPGIFFTNDKNIGCNPCAEISLKPNSFCNLTSINVSEVSSQEDLEERVRAATFIGTLQASYTNFHYLRDVWRRNSEKESLLGVSMTGIASGAVLGLDLEKAAKVAVEENKRVAKMLGINPAFRIGTIKPEGTSSCVAGSSSGIHAWFAKFFIRRMRLGKDESLYTYLSNAIPELIEDEYFNPEKQAVLSLPIKAPEGSIFRDEDPLDLLERVKHFHDTWIKGSHVKGSNTHNVSVTVSIKDDEWGKVGEWMWNNRDSYNGISVLPYDGGSYKQTPFEECTEEVYVEMLQHIDKIDLTEIKEEQDTTDLSGEVACGGGSCEVDKI